MPGFTALTAAFESKLASEKASKLSNLMCRNFKFLENARKEKYSFFLSNGPKTPPSYAFLPFFPTQKTTSPIEIAASQLRSQLRSGCIAVLGAANAGKSTLINHLVGTKCLPVSSKPQTTRAQTLTVKTEASNQVVFVDTPGFSREYALGNLHSFLTDADALMYVVDVSKPFFSFDCKVAIPQLQAARSDIPFVLVLNKIDKCTTERLERIKEQFSTSSLSKLAKIFCTNALQRSLAVQRLEEWIYQQICHPVQEFPFPPVNQPVLTPSDQVLECIREKIYKRYNAEIPYSVKLEIVAWNESRPGLVTIAVDLIVAKPTHQTILLGTKGEALQWVRERAEKELEKCFGKRTSLFIRVALSKSKQH